MTSTSAPNCSNTPCKGYSVSGCLMMRVILGTCSYFCLVVAFDKAVEEG